MDFAYLFNMIITNINVIIYIVYLILFNIALLVDFNKGIVYNFTDFVNFFCYIFAYGYLLLLST